ncbi:hypothetical protein [Roseibacillus ishigakijimensis]|uniref:Beta-barrel porin 2 n=1 Tax=Roseibacillus ishigakijimensis TaxID=454146 RepID=A0A934RMQ3_9BACT|nr:hypothetical protein [Roseibacillus ishigakijimensis]MBK1833635.1 hypothetical protein [Roseibacillus ishigakijimensis]
MTLRFHSLLFLPLCLTQVWGQDENPVDGQQAGLPIEEVAVVSSSAQAEGVELPLEEYLQISSLQSESGELATHAVPPPSVLPEEVSVQEALAGEETSGEGGRLPEPVHSLDSEVILPLEGGPVSQKRPLTFEEAERAEEDFSFDEFEKVEVSLATVFEYDTNLLLSEEDEVQATSFSISPTLRYLSAPEGGALWIGKFTYTPTAQLFFEDSDYNSVDHLAGVGLSYSGAVIELNTLAGYREKTDSDRFEGGRVEDRLLTFALDTEYYLSEKTALVAEFAYGSFRDDRANSREADSVIASLTGYWSFTPLVRLGPSIRYGSSDSDNFGRTTAVAALLRGQYELSEVVRLGSFLGVERSDKDFDDSSDTAFTFGVDFLYEDPLLPWSLSGEWALQSVQRLNSLSTRLGGGESRWGGRLQANYQWTDFTRFSLSLLYQPIPDPGGSRYSVNDLSFSIGGQHDFGDSLVGLRYYHTLSQYEALQGFGPTPDDQSLSGVRFSYERKMFDDLFRLGSYLAYSSGDGQTSWSRNQIGVTFDYAF